MTNTTIPERKLLDFASKTADRFRQLKVTSPDGQASVLAYDLAKFLTDLGVTITDVSPTCWDVMAAPLTTPVPAKKLARYDLIDALARYASPGTVGDILTYLSRMTPIDTAMALRAMVSFNPTILEAHDFVQWLSDPANQHRVLIPLMLK